MRLEGRNLYVTLAELDRMSELKDDGDSLAQVSGTRYMRCDAR